MSEIVLGFEGGRGDVMTLAFSLFGHSLQIGRPVEGPGDVTLTVKSMPEQRSGPFAHMVLEVAVGIGTNVAVPLFVNWLYDKWKEHGETPISIKIGNHSYTLRQKELIKKELEEAVKKEFGDKTGGR